MLATDGRVSKLNIKVSVKVQEEDGHFESKVRFWSDNCHLPDLYFMELILELLSDCLYVLATLKANKQAQFIMIKYFITLALLLCRSSEGALTSPRSSSWTTAKV